jgi:hypothetical protein
MTVTLVTRTVPTVISRYELELPTGLMGLLFWPLLSFFSYFGLSFGCPLSFQLANRRSITAPIAVTASPRKSPVHKSYEFMTF